jgi:hypothetical protein
MVVAFLGFAALNLALIYYVFPTTLLGRSISYLVGSDSVEIAVSEIDETRVFDCKNSFPPFSLGATSNPSQSDLSKLCSCIWAELPDASRQFSSELASNGNKADDSKLAQIFATSAGIAMRSCGAEDL